VPGAIAGFPGQLLQRKANRRRSQLGSVARARAVPTVNPGTLRAGPGMNACREYVLGHWQRLVGDMGSHTMDLV